MMTSPEAPRLPVRVVLAAWALLAGACGDDGGLEPSGTRSHAVTQGGPQDIGELRQVVDSGAVPSMELLDEVGYFAEHAFDLPDADCGAAVCAHPMLAVAPRFDDGNWTMAFIGLNTRVEPEQLVQRPRHLILVAEHSDQIPELFRSEPPVVTAARTLSAGLAPEERLSVVLAAADNLVLLELGDREAALSIEAAAPLATPEEVDAYGALALALELAALPAAADLATAVVYVNSGSPTRGIHSTEGFTQLADRYVASQVPISSVGIGEGYTREVPELLTAITGGNYYFTDNGIDLQNAIRAEAETMFTPLATGLEVVVEAAPGYRIGEVHGARSVTVEADERRAILGSPVVYVGSRTGSRDVGSSRRGGGGGLFVQLLPDARVGESPEVEADAFHMTLRYHDGLTERDVVFEQTLATPLGVGNNPPPDDPFFSDRDRAKPFMALNFYLALRTSLELYELGTCGGAVGVREMMRRSYDLWRDVYEDRDIDEDWALLQRLTTVIQGECEEPTYEPVSPILSCFYS